MLWKVLITRPRRYPVYRIVVAETSEQATSRALAAASERLPAEGELDWDNVSVRVLPWPADDRPADSSPGDSRGRRWLVRLWRECVEAAVVVVEADTAEKAQQVATELRGSDLSHEAYWERVGGWRVSAVGCPPPQRLPDEVASSVAVPDRDAPGVQLWRVGFLRSVRCPHDVVVEAATAAQAETLAVQQVRERLWDRSWSNCQWETLDVQVVPGAPSPATSRAGGVMDGTPGAVSWKVRVWQEALDESVVWVEAATAEAARSIAVQAAGPSAAHLPHWVRIAGWGVSTVNAAARSQTNDRNGR